VMVRFRKPESPAAIGPAPGRLACAAIMLLFLLGSVGSHAAAEELSASAAIEKAEVFVGEPVQFHIIIEGSERPTAPDMRPLRDFTVESRGGRRNSSQSVTIINGQVTEVSRRGYVFTYQLTAKRAGELTIPSVKVVAEGVTLRTDALRIRAIEPAETDDFKLRMTPAKTKCYVGEHLMLTVTWYIGRDVRAAEFHLPLLENTAFTLASPDTPTATAKTYVPLVVGGREVVAEKGSGRLDGKTYTTLTFRLVLVPRQAGTFELQPATVACEALVARRRGRSSPFGDSFADDFFGRGSGIYKKFVVPSNPLRLDVELLPMKGKPAGFAGHIGAYDIKAEATPTEVNVGDPITLTIAVSGPDYLKDVQFPPLEGQANLARDFKIPAERAAGEVVGNVKTFTQTIRARHAGVDEIPSIALPYFDTAGDKYRVARTRPIPLVVRETRVVTARDAEGLSPVAPKTALTAWQAGIAYNYEDLGVLENQAFGLTALLHSPGWLAAIGLPVVFYLLLACSTAIVRARRADPEAQAAKKAYGRLAATLKAAKRRRGQSSRLYGTVLDALRAYLGVKLRISPGALTYRDVEGLLRAREVSPEALDELQALFEACEAGHYAGAAGPVSESSLPMAERALKLAGNIERSLK